MDNHIFLIIKNNLELFEPEILKDINFRISNKGWEHFIYLKNNIKKGDKIIIHGLNNPRLLLFLAFYPRIIRYCIWSIWGGDVYFYKYQNNRLKHRITESLRKKVIPKIPVITSIVKGDYEEVKKVYRSRAKYVYSIYNPVFDYNSIKESEKTKMTFRNDEVRILIGNSADPSNNHVEIFDTLAIYRNQKIKIITPLSYGGNKEYVEKVCNYGKKIFKKQFIPLLKFQPIEEYNKLLSSVKVLVLNHERQQALGNVFTVLAFQKKIFLRGDITSFNYFKDLGIKVYDTREIKNMNFRDFLFFDPAIGQRNSNIVEKEISENKRVKLWKNVFEYSFE